MVTRFESAKAKLDRYDSHFRELKGAIDEFLRRAYAVARLNVSKSTAGRLHFDLVVTESIPLAWIAILGDAVHNARTALDHIAYDIAVPNGGDGTKTMFPFVLYRDELEKTIKRYTLDLASERDLSVIRAAKPWKRGNPILWRLHELDIVDKHRGLLPCLGSLSIKGGGGIAGPLHRFQPGDALGGISGTPSQIEALALDKDRDTPITFDIVLPTTSEHEISSTSALDELSEIRGSVIALLGELAGS